MTRLLALDTSTDAMSIALLVAPAVHLHESAGGAQASARLLPQVLSMMQAAGCGFHELDAIAYGCGPGAFTGLRTACSVAQGLAFGAGVPVVPVDSLMLVAQDARRQLGDAAADVIWVAMDARMDEVYAGEYVWRQDRWQVRRAPALYAVEALAAVWAAAPPVVVAGSAIEAFGSRLPTRDARTVPVARSRAAALGEVAQQLWLQGVQVDATQALPVYLRDKVALTTEERDAARLAKEAALP